MEVPGEKKRRRCSGGSIDFLQKTAGDAAFVELPERGTRLSIDGEAGGMETTKVTSTINSPLSGEVGEINTLPDEEPKPPNTDPFGLGRPLRLDLSGRGMLLISPTAMLSWA